MSHRGPRRFDVKLRLRETLEQMPSIRLTPSGRFPSLRRGKAPAPAGSSPREYTPVNEFIFHPKPGERPPATTEGSWKIDFPVDIVVVPEYADITRVQKRQFATLLGKSYNEMDEAQHKLAQVLGLVTPNKTLHELKWIYWTDNRMTFDLMDRLECMVQDGVLERRENQVKVCL